MRFVILLAIIIAVSIGSDAQESDLKDLYRRLDSVIANSQYYHKLKVAKINDIKRAGKNMLSDEERYWHNRRLYDEYFVYNADSAMRYVGENLALARRMGNRERENEWKINRAFVLTVLGQLKDAHDELASISPSDLSDPIQSNYYRHKSFLYSHLGQLTEYRTEGTENYSDRSHALEDSAFVHMTPDNPLYLWHKASAKFDNPDESSDIMKELAEAIETSDLDSRIDAMHAYALSRLYGDRGDLDNRVRYLIISGIADVKIDNRDIASLEELSSILLEQGDIDRAYRYITYCKLQALALPNFIRAASLSKTEARVHQLYVNELHNAGERFKMTTAIIFFALILLVILTAVIVNRSHKLSRSRRQFQQVNIKLNANLEELSRSREQEKKILEELQQANDRIGHINNALKEANYVKEECIGATFALCSTYIDKLEAFRKTVGRLARANMWKELRDEASSPAITANELKQFYQSFDKLFLNIYPNFVADFNALLRPEEQINVKPGELNTELRIYALVRLGISDSVKIASLLHCSPQTVYNNRLRVRNKAAIPKENFADAVKSLGRFAL
jgi:cell division protein FtsB